jgi:pyridinium-3,5-biscarboxylic acid mononucleotide sulfurtransferase
MERPEEFKMGSVPLTPNATLNEDKAHFTASIRDLLSPALWLKYLNLSKVLYEMGAVTVAYSGGVDSALLLKVASDVLKERATALTAVSASYPEWELREARGLAETLGVEMIEVETHELKRSGYRANAGDRCYHCKAELFDIASLTLGARGFEGALCYGAITDDLGDHRPGMDAATERGARAPLIEAQLNKMEVRALSKALGLKTWDKPASACLSSRFPYGIEITEPLLEQVGRCEARLMALGLKVFRARFHGDLVRVELGEDELDRLWRDPMLRGDLIRTCKEVGFKFVSIDLEGYRSGSANETLVVIQG